MILSLYLLSLLNCKYKGLHPSVLMTGILFMQLLLVYRNVVVNSKVIVFLGLFLLILVPQQPRENGFPDESVKCNIDSVIGLCLGIYMGISPYVLMWMKKVIVYSSGTINRHVFVGGNARFTLHRFSVSWVCLSFHHYNLHFHTNAKRITSNPFMMSYSK